MKIRELAALLRSGKVSCVELMQQTLRTIYEREAFRSFITIMEQSALEEAAERDAELRAGRDRGPFHGIPIAHKDLFYTRGVRTTAGSLIFRDFVPDFDATIVQRLRNAGAVCVGKTNMHELAFGITSKNPHYGTVLNPRDTSRLAGGSSGGSAALVAAGLLPLATGTDTGGSIRIPASFCGIVGLKPTYGRVSRHGVLPLSFSLDHVGPLAACVEDCALTLEVIAGPDPLDWACSPRPVLKFEKSTRSEWRGLRVGLPKNFYFDRVDGEVAAAIRKCAAELERQGARVSEIQVPDIAEVNVVARLMQISETAALYAYRGDPAEFGEDVWALLQQGKMVAAHEYVNAQRLRRLIRRDFDALWREVDVLVTPTTPTTAPLIEETKLRIGAEEEDTRLASTRLVRAINLLGEPALSMPCGLNSAGLPIGLQLIGKPFSEAMLLGVARALESRDGYLYQLERRRRELQSFDSDIL